jgi:acyl-CoA thioester hydrolase
LHNVTPTYTDTVRFSDTDQMGHVNNSRFLVFLEDARLVFFNTLMPGGFTGRGLILARIEIDYLRPMVYGAGEVEVDVWVDSIGNRSFALGYRIRQGGELSARARSVMVGYDYGTGQSRPMEPEERAALHESLLISPPG